MTALETFQLPRYVYACRTPEAVVFLVTTHDRSFGLSGDHIDGIAMVVRNWPGHGSPGLGETSTETPQLQEIARTLIQRGLLIESTPHDTPCERIRLPTLSMLPPRRTAEC